VEKWLRGRFFFSNYFGFPCEYHSTSSPDTSSSTCCSSQNDKGTNPENIPKSKAVSKIEELLIQEFFHFFFQPSKYSWEFQGWCYRLLHCAGRKSIKPFTKWNCRRCLEDFMGYLRISWMFWSCSYFDLALTAVKYRRFVANDVNFSLLTSQYAAERRTIAI
jgi:hypothetical protein